MFETSCSTSIIIVLIILGYLLGSVPFGLIIVRLAGFGDIRNFGSGNIGATNVVRKAGKFWGLLTLIGDGGKGALAIYLAQYICKDYTVEIYIGLAAILGHVFPIWLKFKGGKAVATSFATFLMLNFMFGLVVCATWIITFLITRTSSLSAIIAFVLAPLMACFLGLNNKLVIATSLISTLVIFRHKDNIKKLVTGSEGKL
jgi:glycerol-3-phosphate acyltransferase PlsY